MASYNVGNVSGLVAGENLSTAQYHFGVTNGSGKVIKNVTNGGVVDGVIQDAPTAADQACALGNRGVTKCVAGAPVTAGTLIMSNGSGRGVLATTGLFFIGRALTGAGADGQIFELLLGVNGYVP